MGLSPGEQAIWDECATELISERPPMIPIDEPIEDLAGFLNAIYDAQQSGQLTEDDERAAAETLKRIVNSPDPAMQIGELQYVEGFGGLSLVFRPGHSAG